MADLVGKTLLGRYRVDNFMCGSRTGIGEKTFSSNGYLFPWNCAIRSADGWRTPIYRRTGKASSPSPRVNDPAISSQLEKVVLTCFRKQPIVTE